MSFFLPYDPSRLRCHPNWHQLENKPDFSSIGIWSKQKLSWRCSVCSTLFKCSPLHIRYSTGKCEKHRYATTRKRERYNGEIPAHYIQFLRAGILAKIDDHELCEQMAKQFQITEKEELFQYIKEMKSLKKEHLLDNGLWWLDSRSRTTSERYKRLKTSSSLSTTDSFAKEQKTTLIFWTKNYAYWGPIVRRARRSTMAFYEMWDYYIFPHLMLPSDGREKSRTEFDSWKGLIDVPTVSSLLSDLASCILPYYYAQERLSCLSYKRVDRMLIMNLSLHMRGNHHLFCSLIHIIHKRNKDRVIQHVD